METTLLAPWYVRSYMLQILPSEGEVKRQGFLLLVLHWAKGQDYGNQMCSNSNLFRSWLFPAWCPCLSALRFRHDISPSLWHLPYPKSLHTDHMLQSVLCIPRENSGTESFLLIMPDVARVRCYGTMNCPKWLVLCLLFSWLLTKGINWSMYYCWVTVCGGRQALTSYSTVLLMSFPYRNFGSFPRACHAVFLKTYEMGAIEWWELGNINNLVKIWLLHNFTT